ncbi:hypothetical protein FOB29_19805 [Bordetella hinzii]|nr:hypothetical protein FOB29_19805 [Bordetella hinzii]
MASRGGYKPSGNDREKGVSGLEASVEVKAMRFSTARSAPDRRVSGHGPAAPPDLRMIHLK